MQRKLYEWLKFKTNVNNEWLKFKTHVNNEFLSSIYDHFEGFCDWNDELTSSMDHKVMKAHMSNSCSNVKASVNRVTLI